jgi:hypothetical protein
MSDPDDPTGSDDDSLYGESVYESGDAVQGSDVLDPIDGLTGDDPDEQMQTGYSPPEREPYELRHPTTAREERGGARLSERLAAEQPEEPFEENGDTLEDQVSAPDNAFDSPQLRTGRLLAPDQGSGSDREKDEVAADVGPAGYASSAEEAAVHFVDDPEGRDLDN